MANIPHLRAVVMHDAEFLDIALSRGVLSIYHKPPMCLIGIINWIPM